MTTDHLAWSLDHDEPAAIDAEPGDPALERAPVLPASGSAPAGRFEGRD